MDDVQLITLRWPSVHNSKHGILAKYRNDLGCREVQANSTGNDGRQSGEAYSVTKFILHSIILCS
jgi:hypothetical protein